MYPVTMETPDIAAIFTRIITSPSEDLKNNTLFAYNDCYLTKNSLYWECDSLFEFICSTCRDCISLSPECVLSFPETNAIVTVRTRLIHMFTLGVNHIDYSLNVNKITPDLQWVHTKMFDHEVVVFRQRTNSITFKFPDTPEIENSTMRNNNVPDPSRHINDYHEEDNNKIYNSQENSFRLRTISEESSDSDDSYLIVFETTSDTKNMADSDDETNCESENDENDEQLTQKVKFDLIPIVHIMVQWDYAYRAARKGPWEEMARDRERFKRRVNSIATVLNPILASQHRAHIFQERFALQK